MHIHVLMLHRNIELILIEVGFFKKILKLLKNLVKVPVLYIVQGHWPNFGKNDYERILHFYNFF